jgi:hypothetical protein
MTPAPTFIEERRQRILGPLDVGKYSPGIERVERRAKKDLEDHDHLCEIAENPEWFKDYSLLNHSIQVSSVMAAIGKARQRSENDIMIGRVAGLLHDMGKVEKSCHIYRLNRKLTAEEKLTIDKHSAFSGDYILDRMVDVRSEDRALLADIHLVVRYHHNPTKVGDPLLREKCFDLNRGDIFVSLMETRNRVGLDQFQAAVALEEITFRDLNESKFQGYALELQASVQTIVRLYGVNKSELMIQL